MDYNAVLKLVIKAQNGNDFARERLINICRAFIQNTSSNISKRKLNWNNDDELSIALIAFNEAINRYNPDKGAGFLTFARRVINQRLVDYFRIEQRHQHTPLYEYDEDEIWETSPIENSKAIEIYKLKSEQEDLAQTMLEFNLRLGDFGIPLDELAEVCPKHKDTRQKLLHVTEILVSDEGLLNTLHRTKRIPAKELACTAKVSRRVLENGRKYIIALVIIMTEPNFSSMKNFAGLD